MSFALLLRMLVFLGVIVYLCRCDWGWYGMKKYVKSKAAVLFSCMLISIHEKRTAAFDLTYFFIPYHPQSHLHKYTITPKKTSILNNKAKLIGNHCNFNTDSSTKQEEDDKPEWHLSSKNLG